MERTIAMSIKELDRAEVFAQLQQRTMTQRQAAETLGISLRQARRLFRKYKEVGARALISKKRGKPSNHQLATGLKDVVLALIQDNYADFGPTLAHEKIVEVHKIRLSVWSVRNIMIVNDLSQLHSPSLRAHAVSVLHLELNDCFIGSENRR